MSHSARMLVALLALAAALRATWWALYVDILENEGVEYVRLASNWFAGRGYVSVFGGTHTLFPPLYPLLIGLVATVAGSEETAARLVSLAAGLVVVAAVVGLARRVFDERVAALAGLLVACHPLLVAMSVTAYSEALYLGLSTAGALATVRCIERPALWRASVVGALVGLAYLTRPEGIALAVPLAGLVALGSLRRGAGVWKSIAHAGGVLAVAALVASPYVVHLSRVAGGFRWEGKSWANDAVSARQREGLPLPEAGRGLGPNGEPRGPFLFPDQEAQLAAPPAERASLMDTLLADPAGRAGALVRQLLGDRPLGAPLVVVLAGIGVAASGWWRTRLLEGAVLLAVPGLALAVLLALEFTWVRYLWPALPIGLVWAAAGADRIGRGNAALLRVVGAPARVRALASASTAAALALAVVALAGRSVTDVAELAQTRRADVRDAGTWIRADHAASAQSSGDEARRPRIAGIGLALAHYAGAEVVYLPEADEARALLFLHRARPDYLALRDSELQQTTYARRWYAERVADPCAEPADLPAGAAAHFRIWRWTCADDGPGPPRAPGAP